MNNSQKKAIFIDLQELFLARKWLKVSKTKGCGGNGERDMEEMEKWKWRGNGARSGVNLGQKIGDCVVLYTVWD